MPILTIPRDTAQEKRRLRQACAARLALVPESERIAAGAEITARLLQTRVYQQASSIFVYINTRGEPDTRVLIEHAWAEGKRVLAPRVRGNGRMDAVAIFSWDDVAHGMLGMREPRKDLPADAACAFDLALVPCVCAGRHGERLGRGAGYYDRFLSLHPMPAVCLCFQALLSDGIPLEPTDVMMDAVATENGVFPSEKGKRIFGLSGQDSLLAL